MFFYLRATQGVYLNVKNYDRYFKIMAIGVTGGEGRAKPCLNRKVALDVEKWESYKARLIARCNLTSRVSLLATHICSLNFIISSFLTERTIMKLLRNIFPSVLF